MLHHIHNVFHYTFHDHYIQRYNQVHCSRNDIHTVHYLGVLVYHIHKDRHKLVPSNLDYSLNILEGLRCHYTLPYQNNQVHQHSRLTHNHHQSNQGNSHSCGWLSCRFHAWYSFLQFQDIQEYHIRLPSSWHHKYIYQPRCVHDRNIQSHSWYWPSLDHRYSCYCLLDLLFHEHKVPHMHVQTNEKYTFNKTPTNALDVYFSCKSLLYERIFFETPVIFVAGWNSNSQILGF